MYYLSNDMKCIPYLIFCMYSILIILITSSAVENPKAEFLKQRGYKTN